MAAVGHRYFHIRRPSGGVCSGDFLAALDDQQARMAPAIDLAEDLHGAIVAMVTTYLTWVFEQPVLARFMFQVRSQVAAGNFKNDMDERNKQRYARLLAYLTEGGPRERFERYPERSTRPCLLGKARITTGPGFPDALKGCRQIMRRYFLKLPGVRWLVHN